MRAIVPGLVLLAASTAASSAAPYQLIPGRVPLDWQGPDGNTVVLDAPQGLIVVDTARSPQHAQAILEYARQRGRPIAAIINSHWHLDHTTGNYDLRQVYPQAKVYASTAIDGALQTFLAKGLSGPDKALTDPAVPQARKDQILRGRYRIAHPDTLRPTDAVVTSGPMTIAGRTLDVHLSKFAATEGDVWLYDPKSRTVVAGDLVVDIVPFMDTACPDGWRKALGEISRVPFRTLVPGHGGVMSRADFATWRMAYDRFVDCGHSSADKKTCVDDWSRDAAKFIDAAHRDYVREAADYYLTTRLRSSPEERQRYCKPLKAS